MCIYIYVIQSLTNQFICFAYIKFLLKNKGMTISGVKNIINNNLNKLDEHNLNSLKAGYYRNRLKEKSKQILSKINNIKKYGKKNSS